MKTRRRSRKSRTRHGLGPQRLMRPRAYLRALGWQEDMNGNYWRGPLRVSGEAAALDVEARENLARARSGRRVAG